jgi:hypothetical protein
LLSDPIILILSMNRSIYSENMLPIGEIAALNLKQTPRGLVVHACAIHPRPMRG